MTVTDAIDLVAMLIENDLCSDETPEHIKPDMRVLQRIIAAVQQGFPEYMFRVDEDDLVNKNATRDRTLRAINTLSVNISAIQIDAIEGKFHSPRNPGANNE